MAKICDITGKYTRSGNNVSHANNKTKRKFYPNLQDKKVYLAEYNLWLNLRITTSVLRTINKNGLLPVLKKAYTQGSLAERLRPLVAGL